MREEDIPILSTKCKQIAISIPMSHTLHVVMFSIGFPDGIRQGSSLGLACLNLITYFSCKKIYHVILNDPWMVKDYGSVVYSPTCIMRLTWLSSDADVIRQSSQPHL